MHIVVSSVAFLLNFTAFLLADHLWRDRCAVSARRCWLFTRLLLSALNLLVFLINQSILLEQRYDSEKAIYHESFLNVRLAIVKRMWGVQKSSLFHRPGGHLRPCPGFMNLKVNIKSVELSAWNMHHEMSLLAEFLCNLKLEKRSEINLTDGNWLK